MGQSRKYMIEKLLWALTQGPGDLVESDWPRYRQDMLEMYTAMDDEELTTAFYVQCF